MKALRATLAGLCFFIFGLGGFLIGAASFPILCIFLPKRVQYCLFPNIVHKSWKFFVWILTFCKLIKINIENSQDLSGLHGHIIVSNHPSLIDIVILISMIPNTICIVKGKLAHNFFMKFIINRIYIVNNLDTTTLLDECTDALKRGLNIIIFPEGTRTRFDSPKLALHRGFAHLAIKTKAPVLPILINLYPRILGKNQKWYDVSTSTVVYNLTVFQVIRYNNTGESEHTASKNLTYCVKQKIFNDFL